MANTYEIERKFLVEFPELNKLGIKEKLNIVQIYLNDGEKNEQRRVRMIDNGKSIKYVYTEKQFLTAVTRTENEFEINYEKYESLLDDLKKEYAPVKKTRYKFLFKEQLFELDTYSFSREKAILELELDNPEQKILFPDDIHVIKEVTEDRRYSNAVLATSGKFPDINI